MSARSFTAPLVSVANGQAQLPPEPGPDPEPKYGTPRDVVKAWIRQGARRLYIVDTEGGANHAPISAAISASHGHALVDLEAGVASQEDLDRALATGCHHVVINATESILPEALSQHRKRIAVKVGVHEAAFSSHATARDGSDLWSLIERLEDLGPYQYIIMNTDHHGHWRHKSLQLLAAVLESIRAPAVTIGGVAHLEDLHRLVEMSSDGLEGAVVSEGLYSGGFQLSEAEAAIEPRYDPYIWAPADPNLPQVGDATQDDPSAPPVSSL